MAELIIGPPQGLRFQVEWSEPTDTNSPVETTSGRLLVWAGEDLAWGELTMSGEYRPLEWGWIELLEFLSRNWPYLSLESGYPFGLRLLQPTELSQQTEERSHSMPEDRWRQEEKQVFAFENSHNLACGVQGYYLPDLWVVREQGIITVGTEKTTIRRPKDEVLNTLEEFGDALCERIIHLDDSRSRKASRDWRDRKKQDLWKQAQIATGVQIDELRKITGGNSLKLFEIPRGLFEITEALDLVCMTRGILGSEHIVRLISYLRLVPHTYTPGLDALSKEAREIVAVFANKKSYDQGYKLAQWYRERPRVIDAQGRVYTSALLERLGVPVHDRTLGSEELDAIAFWGPRHGPVVFVNRNDHNRVPGARRATLAHELCHILIDRAEALPLGDVMNGNVPWWFEQRANAFAAELLLPRSEAARTANASNDIESCVRELSEKFEVSKELAAWQIRNSTYSLSPSDRTTLRRMVRGQRDF